MPKDWVNSGAKAQKITARPFGKPILSALRQAQDKRIVEGLEA
jgi:hypothetical protein